jgi:hypothetical protein
MYTITYANGCRIWDVPKYKLLEYIITSEQDIAAVYEGSTPITNRVRKEMAGALFCATPAARRFISSLT